MRDFYLEQITWDIEYNPDSNITLYILHKGAAFRICYVAEALKASPLALEQHRECSRILHQGDGDPDAIRPVAERLTKPFEELMNRLLPSPATEFQLTESLHGYLYPPSFELEARAAESSEGVVQAHFLGAVSRQKGGACGLVVGFLQPHLSSLLALNVKTYSSGQVQVLAYHVTPRARRAPSKVLVGNTVFFFKLFMRPHDHGRHELQSFVKILADAEASRPLLSEARICRLHGLLIDEDDDVLQHYDIDDSEEYRPGVQRLVGLLFTYIDNKGTLRHIAPWSDCSNEDRSCWSRQIHNTVTSLHAAGVVWGDAKPENVLIDQEDNACLIDFGGSYTPGWVDREKQETAEGDWQGVKRIDEWLARWSHQPITSRLMSR
ncbi:Uu.00g142020.m01.CDS01 [Anthostomella pinea]|uniref:Uu.00g142020.m01.CDS01 n=1 Tax=Anthostomella pinea TaxID=933095 RepID=A0AAI8VQC7_9PEZI|nr:Uu.00g142020.m01.CDS01 [Anthostomella pinea]